MSSCRKVSRIGFEFIKSYEGFRAHPARLPDGRWTIGHGHVTAEHPGGEIDQDEAERVLRDDIKPIERVVSELVEASLTQAQFDALVSLAFNIGVRRFLMSGVLRHINDDRFTDAAALFEIWRRAHVDGRLVVVDELVRRRAAERALFLASPDGPAPAPSAEVKPVADPDAIAGAPAQTPVRLQIDFDDIISVVEAAPTNSARETGLAADRAIDRMRKAWPEKPAVRERASESETVIEFPPKSASDRAVARLRAAMQPRPAPQAAPRFTSPPRTPQPPRLRPYVSGANALALGPVEDVQDEVVPLNIEELPKLTSVDVGRQEGHNDCDGDRGVEDKVIEEPAGHIVTREPIARDPGGDVAEAPTPAPAGPPRSVAEAVTRLRAIVPEVARPDLPPRATGEDRTADAAITRDDETSEPPFDDTLLRDAPASAEAAWREPEAADDDPQVVERLAAALARSPQPDIDQEMWRDIVRTAHLRPQPTGRGGGAAMLGLVGAVMVLGGSFELAQFAISTPTPTEQAVWWTFAVTGATAMASSAFLLIRRMGRAVA